MLAVKDAGVVNQPQNAYTVNLASEITKESVKDVILIVIDVNRPKSAILVKAAMGQLMEYVKLVTLVVSLVAIMLNVLDVKEGLELLLQEVVRDVKEIVLNVIQWIDVLIVQEISMRLIATMNVV